MGSAGATGKAGVENEILLAGDEGDSGVLNGSSDSAPGTGAGIMRDALSSAATEALVGPSSGYLE